MTASSRSIVPCGDCHLCCRMMTPLRPDLGDEVASYRTATWINAQGGPMLILDRLPNGDCFYLGEHGCTIYASAPYSCRAYDCRETFRNSDRTGRRLAVKNGAVKKEIFDRGRELLQARSS